jgi:hypothetical protein
MEWVTETLNTPGECHTMLRMNKDIFLDLHDVLVDRYGLKLSKHMNTYEMLAIFLFICGGLVDVSQIEEGKIGSSILVKPLVGNSMKFLIVWLQWLQII